MELDSAAQERYRLQGFARLGILLEPADVAELHARLDELRETCPAGPSGVIVHDIWRRHERFAALVNSPVLGALACALMEQPRALLFQDNLVWKLPGSPAIEWHQDYSYQPLDAPRGVTLWLSLDATDPESGCLHYVPGTHRLGIRAPADFIAGSNQPQREGLPPLDIEAHREAIVAVPTAPGELLAHHPLVWHRSPPNASPRHRRAISVNWIDAAVRWMPSQAPHPFNYQLGTADGDAFDPAMFPVFALDPGAEDGASSRGGGAVG